MIVPGYSVLDTDATYHRLRDAEDAAFRACGGLPAADTDPAYRAAVAATATYLAQIEDVEALGAAFARGAPVYGRLCRVQDARHEAPVRRVFLAPTLAEALRRYDAHLAELQADGADPDGARAFLHRLPRAIIAQYYPMPASEEVAP